MTGRLSTEAPYIKVAIGFFIIAGCLVALIAVVYVNYSETASCSTTVCGQYVQTSCHPEIDGPAYYSKRSSALVPTWISRGELVATCSFGECRGPTPASPKLPLPPPEWTSCIGSIRR